MASIEFVTKRIEGKEKELDKLQKKLDRIYKAQATNWEVNPYYYSEYDLRRTLRDIETATKALNDYKAQLVVETEKANSRNVQVILDFLEMWKNRVRGYYLEGLTEYYNDEKAVLEAGRAYEATTYGTPERAEAQEKYETLRNQFSTDCHGVYEKKYFTNRWGRQDYKKVKVTDGKYEYLRPYSSERTLEEALTKLDKDLTQEANRKYDFIIERTNYIVGEITDASQLRIGAKSDLNGYIIGTKGTAKVQTIGAGGYNIQCFHFRTLINKAK